MTTMTYIMAIFRNITKKGNVACQRNVGMQSKAFFSFAPEHKQEYADISA